MRKITLTDADLENLAAEIAGPKRVTTRRQAIREWTCPNHPEGPPTLPADGWEREELTIDQAFEAAQVHALRQVIDSARRAQLGIHADTVEAMFGTCCIGHVWKTVGYEMVEVSGYELLLMEMRPPLMDTSCSVLLSELSPKVEPGGHPLVRIPMITDPKPDA